MWMNVLAGCAAALVAATGLHAGDPWVFVVAALFSSVFLDLAFVTARLNDLEARPPIQTVHIHRPQPSPPGPPRKGLDVIDGPATVTSLKGDLGWAQSYVAGEHFTAHPHTVPEAPPCEPPQCP